MNGTKKLKGEYIYEERVISISHPDYQKLHPEIVVPLYQETCMPIPIASAVIQSAPDTVPEYCHLGTVK